MDTDKEPLKLKNNAAGGAFSEPIKEYQVPSRETDDGRRVPVTPVLLVDPLTNPIQPFSNCPWGRGTPSLFYDATLNNSNKTLLTVPAGKVAQIKSVWANYACDATVGNRFPQVIVTDGTNTIFTVTCGTMAAGGSGVYSFGPFLPSLKTGNDRSDGLPDLILPAGYVIRFWDSAAVSAGGDDMTVSLLYVLFDL